MAITYSTLESQAYSTLLTFLQDNITDPRDPNGNRKFIYDSDPLHKAIDFSNFPYIVFELSIPSPDAGSRTTDGKGRLVTWKHTITVRTVKDGSGGNLTDRGRSDMLSICDDLQSSLADVTNRVNLGASNIRNLILTKIQVDTPIIAEEITYESIFELQYSTRIQVSA